MDAESTVGSLLKEIDNEIKSAGEDQSLADSEDDVDFGNETMNLLMHHKQGRSHSPEISRQSAPTDLVAFSPQKIQVSVTQPLLNFPSEEPNGEDLVDDASSLPDSEREEREYITQTLTPISPSKIPITSKVAINEFMKASEKHETTVEESPADNLLEITELSTNVIVQDAERSISVNIKPLQFAAPYMANDNNVNSVESLMIVKGSTDSNEFSSTSLGETTKIAAIPKFFNSEEDLETPIADTQIYESDHILEPEKFDVTQNLETSSGEEGSEIRGSKIASIGSTPSTPKENRSNDERLSNDPAIERTILPPSSKTENYEDGSDNKYSEIRTPSKDISTLEPLIDSKSPFKNVAHSQSLHEIAEKSSEPSVHFIDIKEDLTLNPKHVNQEDLKHSDLSHSNKEEGTASDTNLESDKVADVTPSFEDPLKNVSGQSSSDHISIDNRIRDSGTTTEDENEYEPIVDISAKPIKTSIDAIRDFKLTNGQVSSTSSRNPSANSDRNFTPLLPPLPNLGALLNDDPFDDEVDTSSDSLNNHGTGFRTLDYLSVWHNQEDKLQNKSPILDRSFQVFSPPGSAPSSRISSNSSQGSQKFKLKPVLVTRSRIYHPDKKVLENDLSSTANDSRLSEYTAQGILLSRSIQEALKKRRNKFFLSSYKSSSIEQNKAFSSHPDLGEDDEILESFEIEELKNVSKASKQQSISGGDLQDTDVDLTKKLSELSLPSISLQTEFKNQFENLLDISLSNTSRHSHELKQDSFQLWDNHDHLKKDGHISNEVLADLLKKEEAAETYSLLQQSLSLPTSNGLTQLKNIDDDVSVRDVSNMSGFEATMSVLDGGSKISIEKRQTPLQLRIDSDKETAAGEEILTPLSRPEKSSSPSKSYHIPSPFKVVSPKKQVHCKTKQLESSAKVVATQSKFEDSQIMDLVEMPSTKDEPVPGVSTKSENYGSILEMADTIQHKELQKDAANTTNKIKAWPDKGTLYLNFHFIERLNLPNIKQHNASYCLEFDNSIDTTKTSWTKIPNDGNLILDNEFELPIDNFMNNRILITLKVKYHSVVNEIVEVVERVPLGKKFIFGKTRFRENVKFVERPSKSRDEWDYLVAKDGSVGQAELVINEKFLNSSEFAKQTIELDLINKWARLPTKGSQTHNVQIYELARRPGYKIGCLKIDACYLSRTSELESLPKSLSIARKVVEKYRRQAEIEMEGYLLQEGGDVGDILTNRYYKLKGIELIGYHEISMAPKININLLNVVQVLHKSDILSEDEKNDNQRRNITDILLFNESFQLVFADGERITLVTDSTSDTPDAWYHKLKEVVDLNCFHQPWVKKFNESLY